MTVLIIAEHDNATLHASTLSCITAGLELGSVIDVLVLGDECSKVVENASILEGVSSVLYANNKRFLNCLAEDVCHIIKNMSTHYEFIVAPATTFGKNCLPRLGAIFDVQPITDVIKINNPNYSVLLLYTNQ